MNPQPKRPKGRKLPKGRVMFVDLESFEKEDSEFSKLVTLYGYKKEKVISFGVPVAVIPCATRKHAAEVVWLHSRSQEEKIESAASALFSEFHPEEKWRTASQIDAMERKGDAFLCRKERNRFLRYAEITLKQINTPTHA